MKRKIKIKPRFWAILATFVIVTASMISGCGKQEKTQIIEDKPVAKCMEVKETVPETAEVKEYILNIPLFCELQDELYNASEEFGVDYYIMVALIEHETNFKNVFGDGGNSYGYCQIQPQWWYGLMLDIGATDLTVPKDNFRTACAIIAQLTEKNQSIEGALVEYNQGYYNGSSTSYSRDIIANAERYRA